MNPIGIINIVEDEEPHISILETIEEPWISSISVVEDDYPQIRIEEINEGVGLICITGITEGNGITIDIIKNLIGLLYRSGEMDLAIGDNRINYSTPFEADEEFVTIYELTALSDGSIIGGDFTNLDDLDGFDVNVKEPAHIKYHTTIDLTGEGELPVRGGLVVTGEKQTGVDAGVLGQESITDDYLYKCVFGGIAGVAIWKKTILFQT